MLHCVENYWMEFLRTTGRPDRGPLPAASLEVQPSDSLRGQRIDIFDEQYLVALLIVNEIVHLVFR